MGRVRESEETDDGAGRGAARGAECAARQKHGSGAGGRGPLLLSDHKDGKPYYLRADGTAPAPSKVAVRPVPPNGQVAVRWCAARSIYSHAARRAGGGLRTQRRPCPVPSRCTVGCAAVHSGAWRYAARPGWRGARPRGAARRARAGSSGGSTSVLGRGEATHAGGGGSCRRSGDDQASGEGTQTGLLAGGLRFGTSQLGTEVRYGEVTPLECQGR